MVVGETDGAVGCDELDGLLSRDGVGDRNSAVVSEDAEIQVQSLEDACKDQ